MLSNNKDLLYRHFFRKKGYVCLCTYCSLTNYIYFTAWCMAFQTPELGKGSEKMCVQLVSDTYKHQKQWNHSVSFQFQFPVFSLPIYTYFKGWRKLSISFPSTNFFFCLNLCFLFSSPSVLYSIYLCLTQRRRKLMDWVGVGVQCSQGSTLRAIQMWRDMW